MRKLAPKQQDIVKLANKKGTDADLFVLDKVHEVQDALEQVKSGQPDLDKVLAAIRGKDGTNGNNGTQGATGLRGEKGDEGAPGAQGIPGKDGRNGKDGVDGTPGRDGAAGKDADETSLLAQISALREEFEARLGQFEAQSNESAAKGQPVVYGPGKTKLIVLDLSTQLDGTTKTFQLGTNFGIVNVSSSSAPFGAFRPVIDYNGVGKTIVFTSNVDAPSALAAGQSLIVTILK